MMMMMMMSWRESRDPDDDNGVGRQPSCEDLYYDCNVRVWEANMEKPWRADGSPSLRGVWRRRNERAATLGLPQTSNNFKSEHGHNRLPSPCAVSCVTMADWNAPTTAGHTVRMIPRGQASSGTPMCRRCVILLGGVCN